MPDLICKSPSKLFKKKFWIVLDQIAMVICVRTGARLLILVLLSTFSPSVTSQSPTSLNIDCGGDKPFTDGIGIDWVTDDDYITTGENLEITDLRAGPGLEPYLTARYFPENRSKHCYVLPAQADSTYLIIAIFLHGKSKELPLPVKFDVTVNSNHWFTHSLEVIDDDLVNYFVFEAIIRNKRDHIDVCFKAPESGIAWISSLELRQLLDSMYIIVRDDDRFLSLMFRYNTGILNGTSVRWPDDEFDRSWDPYPKVNLRRLSNDTELLDPSHSDGHNRPPVAVMADAIFAPELALDLPISRPNVKEIYFSLFFQIIRGLSSVTQSNPVSMTAGLEGQSVEFNLTDGVSYQVFGNTTVTDRSVTLEVTPSPGYVEDVFLNAFEIYELSNVNNSFTLESDVSALELLQKSFGLSSWTGDPCYSVPYDWLECDDNNRITVLNLSKKNITGTIPNGIGKLKGLREIYLDNNALTGPIPASLSSLPDLTVLSLENNSLSGSVPWSLQRDEFSFSGNPDLIFCKTNETVCNTVIPDPAHGPTKNSSGASLGLIIGVAVGVSVVVSATIAGLCFLWKRRQKNRTSTSGDPINELHGGEAVSFGQSPPSRNQKTERFDQSHGSNLSVASEDRYGNNSQRSARSTAHQVAGFLSLAELKSATNDFQRKVGEGGYGPVYYGRLSNGREVAVKVNKVGAHHGNDEFVNEVALLTRVHHKNLVSLLGFCEDQNQRLLVYEYLHNGTLSDLLYGPYAATRPVSWETRLGLAVDAARGLEYLHTGCHPRIIHRDVKSSNILIDDQMVAKVSDFGISKSAPDLQTTISGHMSTVVRGTPGYLDPEYYMLHRLSQKSDVYSFGVVLAEMISGRRPIVSNPDGSVTNLATFLVQCMKTCDLSSIADPTLKGAYNPESLWNVVELAMSCIDQKGANRPNMGNVVRRLVEAYDIESNGSTDANS